MSRLYFDVFEHSLDSDRSMKASGSKNTERIDTNLLYCGVLVLLKNGLEFEVKW
jgi:hypothetical protein